MLNPAGVQEILDYGLYGIALSRYSGCWAALKCVHDTVEASASIEVGPERAVPIIPRDHVLPEDGVHIRFPDPSLDQEARLHEHKIEAAKAFCKANKLDRTVFPSPEARVGVVTAGKSYLDVRQALDDLGIDETNAEQHGLRLYKVAMTWPLEPDGARAFCEGLDFIVVVEEKRALIETQLKTLMYGRDGAPVITGKQDVRGWQQFRSANRLDPNRIAAVIGRALLEHGGRPQDSRAALEPAVQRLEQIAEAGSGPAPAMLRTPYFCPGCPHNSSTKVPEGMRALSGIGCHYMAQWMDRRTAGFTQMGGEGASWIGEAPFSKRKHVFQNIGDGTYFHSGLLALRAAIAARDVNVTFKILYNDAVAMTGGQPMDGPLDAAAITRQTHAEGAKAIAVVTDEPGKYSSDARFAPGVTVHHRRELEDVQRRLAEIEGVTVLVYDQTCAAEKRRRRKRGAFPNPAKRAFINPAVCEGCGDCGVKSNCVAITPLETEFGRKRQIDQSACNKDYSCVEGFCPSFVTVHGGQPRKGKGAGGVKQQPLPVEMSELAEPELPSLERPYGVVVTGVGGTGVVTIGALIGMAAHLEGKGCSVLDMMGLAQKGGAVTSHLRIAASPDEINATRIAGGGADVMVGCDLVVSAGPDALATVTEGRTQVVVNAQQVLTGDFTRNPDFNFPAADLQQSIEARAGKDAVQVLDATRIATALMGDSIATNLFMLGYAFQRGLLPLSSASIVSAIELNGVAVEMNVQAFTWGRRTAVDPETVLRLAKAPQTRQAVAVPESVEQLIERRSSLLSLYQDEAYAARYRKLVDDVVAAERKQAKGSRGLGEAVARYYFKLMAYKDEYEVARLYTDEAFAKAVDDAFEGEYTLEFHLAPPLLARRDKHTGEPRKRAYGPWMMRVFGWLARAKRLRGTPFDPFGYTSERRMERKLIKEYEHTMREVIERLDSDNHALAVQVAEIPEQIRGFGPVKERHRAKAKAREAELLESYRASGAQPVAA